jgi:hypothetical protein
MSALDSRVVLSSSAITVRRVAADKKCATGYAVTQPSSIRVLRWVFSRDRETLHCELALDPSQFRYELRLHRGDQPNGVLNEGFGDVAKAFARQCELEAALLTEGWTLDRYESADRLVV